MSQPPLIEPWITKRELADLMGISPRTVDRLVAAGMPSVKWGPKTRRFRASVAMSWTQAHASGEDSGTVQPLRRAS